MNDSKKQQITGILILVLTALIWGTAFVAQSSAMDSIGPLIFTAMRSLLGGLVLIPIYVLTSGGKPGAPFKREKLKNTLTGGAVCGIILFFSMNFQQVGLVYASPGKGAFITALYIIFVPIVGCFIGKRPGVTVWIGAVVATVGFYLLNIVKGEGFGLGIGELLILLCAVSFTFHIIAVDKYGAGINAALLSCMQFFVAGVLSAACAFLDVALLGYSAPTLESVWGVIPNIAYLGVFSSGIAYTLQIAGQKRVPSGAASLIMSLESVFAVIAAWLILKEALQVQQIVGCVLIFAAVIVSQLQINSKDGGADAQ